MRQTTLALLGATLTVGAAIGLVWLTQNPPPEPPVAVPGPDRPTADLGPGAHPGESTRITIGDRIVSRRPGSVSESATASHDSGASENWDYIDPPGPPPPGEVAPPEPPGGPPPPSTVPRPPETRREKPPPPVVSRTYRFTEDEAREAWVAKGAWKTEGGQYISTATPEGGAIGPHLTLGTYYATIEEIRITGGIRRPSTTNFRLQVGPVSAILNWEVARENHFRIGTKRTMVPGHALEPGRDSDIVLRQDGDLIRFSVDGKELWVARGKLHGTVTAYPALGSTIGIKDVQIRGRAVPGVEVEGPPYPLQ